MRNLHFNLLAGLLTFGIGVVIVSTWVSVNSVDRRYANALRASYPEVTDQSCKKQSLSHENCKKLKDRISNSNDQMLAIDLENTESGCRVDNLSEAECAQRKEAAIKDIEQNFLNKRSANK